MKWDLGWEQLPDSKTEEGRKHEDCALASFRAKAILSRLGWRRGLPAPSSRLKDNVSSLKACSVI